MPEARLVALKIAGLLLLSSLAIPGPSAQAGGPYPYVCDYLKYCWWGLNVGISSAGEAATGAACPTGGSCYLGYFRPNVVSASARMPGVFGGEAWLQGPFDASWVSNGCSFENPPDAGCTNSDLATTDNTHTHPILASESHCHVAEGVMNYGRPGFQLLIVAGDVSGPGCITAPAAEAGTIVGLIEIGFARDNPIAITIPGAVLPGDSLGWTIDWGDEEESAGGELPTEIVHSYEAPGIYDATVTLNSILTGATEYPFEFTVGPDPSGWIAEVPEPLR